VYIDQPYLNEMLGAEKVTALVGTATLATMIEAAEGETETALQNGGYAAAVPSSVYASVSACPKVIRLAALGAWLELAYGRNELDIPEGYRAHIKKLDDIRSGKIEIPGVAKTVRRAPGGVDFTESSTSVTVENGSRPSIFNRRSMQGH
jgi:hypothetical protein